MAEICDHWEGPGTGDICVINEAAGAGMAYVIKALQLYHQGRGEVVVIWGTSGQAACVIGGVTMHCGAGMTVDLELEEMSLELRVLLAIADVLIIDEVVLAVR